MIHGWPLSWRKIGPFLLTDTGCRHYRFWYISLIYWTYFSDMMISPGFRAIVNQMGSRPPNNDHEFFWCKFGLGKCFGASSPSNHWVGHCWFSYKTHFSSHITIQSRNPLLLLHRIRQDDTSNQWLFLICSQLMNSPFQFARNVKQP